MESLPLGAWAGGALAAPAIAFLAFAVMLRGRLSEPIRGRRLTLVR